jgi:hypothetical protein
VYVDQQFSRDDVMKADWARKNDVDYVVMKRAMLPHEYAAMKE